MKNTFKKLLVFALGIVMMMTMSLSAMAEETTSPTLYKDVRVTKELIFPEGATLPADTKFSFDVEFVDFTSHDGTVDAAADHPAISVDDLTFTGDMGSAIAGEGVKKAVKQSNNLLDGLTFEKAGIYTYHITEKTGTVTLGEKEAIDYNTESVTHYVLRVYTKNAEDGKTIIIDGGTVEKPGEGKVDPSPGDKPGTEVTEEGSNALIEATNGFKFLNRYKKLAGSIDPGEEPGTDPETDPGDPSDKDTGLHITKTVVGDYADLDKEFTFTLNIPENMASEVGAPFKLYAGSKAAVDVNPGTAVTFTLKHGERAKLQGIQVGASFTVTESDYSPYTVSNTTMLNSVKGSASDSANGGGQLGEKRNKVDYTNTHGGIIPTGIIINNLPYILLVAVALAGISLYFVSRRRRNSEDEA